MPQTWEGTIYDDYNSYFYSKPNCRHITIAAVGKEWFITFFRTSRPVENRNGNILNPLNFITFIVNIVILRGLFFTTNKKTFLDCIELHKFLSGVLVLGELSYYWKNLNNTLLLIMEKNDKKIVTSKNLEISTATKQTNKNNYRT